MHKKTKIVGGIRYDDDSRDGAMCTSPKDPDLSTDPCYEVRYWNINISEYDGLMSLGHRFYDFNVLLNSNGYFDELAMSIDGPPKVVGIVNLFRIHYDINSAVVSKINLDEGAMFKLLGDGVGGKHEARVKNWEFNEKLKRIELYNSNCYLLDPSGGVSGCGVKHGRYESVIALLMDCVQVLNNFKKWGWSDEETVEVVVSLVMSKNNVIATELTGVLKWFCCDSRHTPALVNADIIHVRRNSGVLILFFIFNFFLYFYFFCIFVFVLYFYFFLYFYF